MVTDRTQADVTYALANKDTTTPLKGAYNYTDLNRVESKVAELETLLKDYGYLHENLTTKTDWAYTDFFKPIDAQRYLSNIKKLRDSFIVLPNTPVVPGTMQGFDYVRANEIEKILVDIEVLINNMLADFYYAGEVYSGEVEA